MHAFGITLRSTTAVLFLLCLLVPQYAAAHANAQSAQDVCFWDDVETASLCNRPSLHVSDDDINDASATLSRREAPTERVIELPSWGSILAAANEAVKSAGDGLSTIASEFDVNEVVKAAGEGFSTISSEFNMNQVFKTAGECLTTITSEFDVKRRVEELESTIQDIVAASSEIRGHMAELTQKGLTLDNISDELEGIFNQILVYLEETFPPPDQAPSHKERLKMTATILDKVEQAILDFGRKHGMSEDGLERVRKTFSSSKPHIEKLVVLTGDLAEQHPVLSKALISAAVAMLLSKLDIPRRILGVIGFGPRGPTKGSLAAWAQRRFWGATVEKDSWFSILQKAGMLKESPVEVVAAGLLRTFLH